MWQLVTAGASCDRYPLWQFCCRACVGLSELAIKPTEV
jgi:hypothetical protein